MYGARQLRMDSDRTDFASSPLSPPTPVRTKAGAMPTNDGLRLYDGKDPQHRGKPAVKLDEKQPIEICKPDPAARLTPQHHHLMPQRRILKLKPTFRFEWRSQDGPHEP